MIPSSRQCVLQIRDKLPATAAVDGKDLERIECHYRFLGGFHTPVGFGTFEGLDRLCVPAARISFGFAAWDRVGSACTKEEA